MMRMDEMEMEVRDGRGIGRKVLEIVGSSQWGERLGMDREGARNSVEHNQWKMAKAEDGEGRSLVGLVVGAPASSELPISSLP